MQVAADREFLITDAELSAFAKQGYLLLRGFYDFDRDVAPIQEGIRKIIEILCRKYDVIAPTQTALDAMTKAYPALIAKNRSWGGEVYDAIKQIPGFYGLVSHSRNARLFQALRPDSTPGLAQGGYGIRIDNPGEGTFKAAWHQEFPYQLRSLDGIVFWSPLLAVTKDMGPVDIAEGSHAEGMIPVYYDKGDHGQPGAYAIRMHKEQERLARYKVVAPLTQPGDLLLIDFLTLHQSGNNISSHARWSMQFRYFNFTEETGIKIGWRGSIAVGAKFGEILPELMAPETESIS